MVTFMSKTFTCISNYLVCRQSLGSLNDYITLSFYFGVTHIFSNFILTNFENFESFSTSTVVPILDHFSEKNSSGGAMLACSYCMDRWGVNQPTDDLTPVEAGYISPAGPVITLNPSWFWGRNGGLPSSAKVCQVQGATEIVDFSNKNNNDCELIYDEHRDRDGVHTVVKTHKLIDIVVSVDAEQARVSKITKYTDIMKAPSQAHKHFIPLAIGTDTHFTKEATQFLTQLHQTALRENLTLTPTRPRNEFFGEIAAKISESNYRYWCAARGISTATPW